MGRHARLIKRKRQQQKADLQRRKKSPLRSERLSPAEEVRLAFLRGLRIK